MTDTWIGGATALAGVIVGVVAEAWRTRANFKRERSWDLYREDLRQLEQIYEALEEVRDSYNETAAPILTKLATGVLPSSAGSARRVPWARLRMLVHLYAPQLRDRLAAVAQAGPKLGEVIGRALLAASADRSKNSQWGDSIVGASKQLDVAIDAMCDDLTTQVRALTKEAAAQTDYSGPEALAAVRRR